MEVLFDFVQLFLDVARNNFTLTFTVWQPAAWRENEYKYLESNDKSLKDLKSVKELRVHETRKVREPSFLNSSFICHHSPPLSEWCTQVGTVSP